MAIINTEDILFIINPNSGTKRSSKLIEEIYSLNSNISYVTTKDLNDLKKTFRLNIEKYRAFIVVGGDGTVNEALKYLCNRADKYLGVFPTGSGNGFARELGFTNCLNTLIRDVQNGESIDIDVLSINDSLCINVAGIGIDSFIAHDFHERKGRGLINYIYSTIKSLLVFKPFNATVTINNKKIQKKFMMITIANTRQFGNNAFIAPHAKPNDGIFELVLVEQLPFYLYPIFVIKLFLGTLKDSKYISYFKIKDSIEIISKYKKYHIDGEPKIFFDNISVKMSQKKVRVIKSSRIP